MTRLSSLPNRPLTGIGLTRIILSNSFTGRLIATGVATSSTSADPAFSYALDSHSTWIPTTTPSSLSGANAPNWISNTSISSSGTAVMVINGQSGHTATTTDGITWTERTRLTPNSAGLKWNSVAFGNNTWVTIYGGDTSTASTLAAYSTNTGSTWNYVTIPSGRWGQVIFGGGRFVCKDLFSPSNNIYSTDNGITWIEGGQSPLGLGSPQDRNSFLYAGGTWNRFINVRENSGENIRVASSVDSINWTLISSSAPGVNIFTSVFTAFGNDRLVSIQGNNVWYSRDLGESWARVANPFDAATTFSGLYFFHGVFIAVSRALGVGGVGATYISKNGIIWTQGGTSTGINNQGRLSFLNS